MNDNMVITIGRECGSGGRQIGMAVAKRMGVKCYDQELLTLAAKNRGLCEDIFRNHDEKLASEESCVIVGRCADYALEGHPHLVTVFVCGNEEDKIPYLMKRYDIDAEKARDQMIKTDKRRASYYNYYTNKKWGALQSYDLCLNSSAIGRERCVDMILDFAEAKEAYRKSGCKDDIGRLLDEK